MLLPIVVISGSGRHLSELYKCYDKQLLPLLLNTFNFVVEEEKLPLSITIIVVLPKLGKDRFLPDSYRPIYLLNTDIKLIAKVLASRLTKIITKIAYED